MTKIHKLYSLPHVGIILFCTTLFFANNLLANAQNLRGRSRAFSFPTFTRSGPFYGIPISTKTADRTYLPFSVSGKCKAGTVYNISDVDELLKYVPDLECLFQAGIAPSKVPEGAWYGKTLSFFNSRIINPIVRNTWFGKVATKIECNQGPKYFSFNNILGMPLGPAILSIGPMKEELAPGEYDDGKDSLLVDYSVDFKTVCPNYESYVKEEYESLPVRRRSMNSAWPESLIYDLARVVGRQKDNGIIILAKSLYKDVYREDKQMATVCWWAIVNYDPEVSVDFKAGQALEPQERTFSYMFPGIIDLVLRVLPVDNFMTTPVRTVRRLFGVLNGVARAAVVNAGEVLINLPRAIQDNLNFQRFFRAGRDGRKRVE